MLEQKCAILNIGAVAFYFKYKLLNITFCGLWQCELLTTKLNTKMKTIEQILALIKLNAYSGTPENIQAIVELVNEAQNQALPQADVSGSLGFDKGYEQGYNDATKEACQEIAKNYQPNDR